MKSIEKLYREFYQKNIDSDKENKVINMVDIMAVLNMKQDGYAKDTVLAFIGSISPLASALNKEDLNEYFNEVCSEDESPWENDNANDNSKETREKLLKIYQEVSKYSVQEFEECYFDLDVKVLSDLIDRGFAFAEVDNFFEKNSFFGKRVYDRDAVGNYKERVVEKMRSIRAEKSKNEMETANNKYKEAEEMLSGKQTDGKEISKMQKYGEITLILLVVERFMPETIRDVILKYDEKSDKNTVTEIINACGKIKRMYMEINESVSIDDASSYESTFFSYTKRYMERNSLKLLTFDDECQIIKEISNATEAAGKSANQYICGGLNTLLSPVALEPWRDKNEYISILLCSISDNEQKKENKDFDIKKFSENFIDVLNAKKLPYLSIDSGDYKTTLVVRELFIEHFSDQDIKHFLFSKLSKRDSTYAELVIDKAKNMIKRENELKNAFTKNYSPIILRRKSFVELKKEGLSAFDIYKIVLERKIYDMPSISNRLYEAFFDVDMVESCLSQYRDFDKDELKEIIKNNPRSILLSNSEIKEAENYVENVIAEAEKRLEKADKIQDEKNKMESVFTQEGDITKQGISNSEILKYPYEYSRSALKLLLLGKDRLYVQNMVLNMAIRFKMENPEPFAQSIIESSVKIFNRMQEIKNYNEASTDNDAFETYMQIMHRKYLQKKSLRESMDIEVIIEMLSRSFSKQDIADAVKKRSPFAIEIGRNENYVSHYLIPQAESRIVTAKNSLAKIKPLKRAEKKEDILEEYKDLQAEISKKYPIIPYNATMEELVVASLALEGFSLENIKSMLDSHSPFNNQKNYGEGMANRIADKYLQKSA